MFHIAAIPKIGFPLKRVHNLLSSHCRKILKIFFPLSRMKESENTMKHWLCRIARAQNFVFCQVTVNHATKLFFTNNSQKQ